MPAYLNVVDIAGLVKGASEGQGLGNAFLSHINACDGIFHLCRKSKNRLFYWLIPFWCGARIIFRRFKPHNDATYDIQYSNWFKENWFKWHEVAMAANWVNCVFSWRSLRLSPVLYVILIWIVVECKRANCAKLNYSEDRIDLFSSLARERYKRVQRKISTNVKLIILARVSLTAELD